MFETMTDPNYPKLNAERGRLIERQIANTLTRKQRFRLEYLTGYVDAHLVMGAEVERLTLALRDISTRGTNGEGELPMTPSELREIARDTLAGRHLEESEEERLNRLRAEHGVF